MSTKYRIVKTEEGYDVIKSKLYLNGAIVDVVAFSCAGFDDARAWVEHRTMGVK